MAKRIAYVTGGMGGIGTAICQRLFKDGFTVVAGCGPNSPRRERWLAEQAELGFSFIASEGNVGDWESTEATFAKVKKEVGGIDVLVTSGSPEIRQLCGATSSHTVYTRRFVPFQQAPPPILIEEPGNGFLMSYLRAGLLRMNLKLLRQFCQRALAAYGCQCHLRLERR
jgi:hypothetical protein